MVITKVILLYLQIVCDYIFNVVSKYLSKYGGVSLSIKNLSFLTLIVTFALIVFGGYVASSQSGLGCGPEWPLCNGVVIPTLQGDTLIEFAHRVIGAILGVLTIILFIKVVRANISSLVLSAAYWMIGLLIFQVLLGAIVVWYHLPTFVIAGHLIIAMLYLACVLIIWRQASEKENQYHSLISLSSNQQRKINIHIIVFLGLVILLLFVGAYVKHDFIGTSCGWLTCGDSIIPTTGPEIIQTIHRFLGFAIGIYSILLVYWSFAKKWGTQLQKRFTLVFITVAVQVVLGILTIVTSIDMVWALLHVAVGTLLFTFIAETRLFMVTIVSNKVKLNVVSSKQKAKKTKLKDKFSEV